VEFHLLTDRCSNESIKKFFEDGVYDLKVNPSGRAPFFILFVLFILTAYGFSNSIPWSSEAKMVLYYNAPVSWTLGFENIKGLYKTIKGFDVENTKTKFLEDVSVELNIDSSIVKNFLESKIIVISEEKKDFAFQNFFSDIFNVKNFLESFFYMHEKNIICIERFQGIETLMNVISDFQVESRVFGDFIAFSSDVDYLEEQTQLMINRNEFSEDVIFYSENDSENIEVTNAYSFLNFEQKELIDLKSNQYDANLNTQFLLDNVKIPFDFEDPSYFKINSGDIKSFFYDNFEVYSSIEEWMSVFELLSRGVLYAFLFSSSSDWLLGFKCSDDLLNNEQWQKYTASWELGLKKTIKPYEDEFYISLIDDFFLVSTIQINILDTNNQIIVDIMTKFERNLLLQAEVISQNYDNNNSKQEIYHFSYIDDRIKKDVFRIF
jgi:hypothetical protein